MFDLLRKDISIGDIVKFYLTTGKEPSGIVLEIGENYVLIQSDELTQIRFFDKLIGGWDIIKRISKINPVDIELTDNEGFDVTNQIETIVVNSTDKTEEIGDTLPELILSFESPYYSESDDETTATLVIENIGAETANGFLLTVLCKSIYNDESIEVPYENNSEIEPGSKAGLILVIPAHIISQTNAVTLEIEVTSIYQDTPLNVKKFGFTLERRPHSFLTYDDIPWRDGTIPPEHLFKGRKNLIDNLTQHYLSIERDKPYILYGLTRTGKSSILQYLKKDIEGYTVTSNGKEMTVLPFNWDFSEGASFNKESDFWYYILYQQTYEELEKYSINYDFSLNTLEVNEDVRAKDFKLILDFLASNNLYPLFIIDEFSFVKTLFDDKIINSAFLHTLRQFSLGNLASFIFAGTYDIKTLIKDPTYGITGQLVNAIEHQVNEITPDFATELIKVMNGNLTFTSEAVEQIKLLSGNVPYFIQIICKYCGYYASDQKRRVVGLPELEYVIQILVGKEPAYEKSLVKKLPENTFQNNQFSPIDPKEVPVLISCIAELNKDMIIPRGVELDELQNLWTTKNVNSFSSKLAEAVGILKEKRILLQENKQNKVVYRLSVDLFRRWWYYHNPDINLILTTLTD